MALNGYQKRYVDVQLIEGERNVERTAKVIIENQFNWEEIDRLPIGTFGLGSPATYMATMSKFMVKYVSKTLHFISDSPGYTPESKIRIADKLYPICEEAIETLTENHWRINNDAYDAAVDYLNGKLPVSIIKRYLPEIKKDFDENMYYTKCSKAVAILKQVLDEFDAKKQECKKTISEAQDMLSLTNNEAIRQQLQQVIDDYTKQLAS